MPGEAETRIEKIAFFAELLLTKPARYAIILPLSARLAQLVEHMLDVHGVTGSSPVPRTIVKSPETIMVLGLFVILPKSFVVMIWKMPAKVAEIGFCEFCRSKKTGGLLNWGGRLFCVLELFLSTQGISLISKQPNIPSHWSVQRFSLHNMRWQRCCARSHRCSWR